MRESKIRRVCDGDCDRCPHPDCIDEDGYWDYATPEERALIMGPKGPERTRAIARLSHRRTRHTDPEAARRNKAAASKHYEKDRNDPERWERRLEWGRRYYRRNREKINQRRQERSRQKKAAPGGATPESGKA